MTLASLLLPVLFGVPDAPLDAHALALSANPNEATLRYQWRGALRGMAGVTIPIVESARTPWVLVFAPALEIHNGPWSGAPVPFEYWRGRATLEFGYRVELVERPDRTSLRVSLLATHESAHATQTGGTVIRLGGLLGETARPQVAPSTTQLLAASQVHTNDVGLRLLWVQTFGPTLFAAALTQRFHFASCTLRQRTCDDVRPAGGLETEFDVVLEAFALDADRWWRPYAAVSSFFIPPIELMGLEGRVVLEAGLTLDPGRLGRFRVYGSLLVGHEPGFLREEGVVYGGAGVAFAFF